MMPEITEILVVVSLCLLILIAISAYKLNKLRKTEQKLREEIDYIRYEEKERDRDLEIIENLTEKYRNEVDRLENRKQELNSDIATQVDNVEKLKSSFETTEEEFKKKYMAERKVWLEERQEEYLQMQEDFVDQFKEENRKKMDAAQVLSNTLDELRASVRAATEAARREAEQENFAAFHSLKISYETLHDINRIKEILPELSVDASTAIAKVIWKVYYEKPYTDMVGRVVGAEVKTGIYKITNVLNHKCYIGQAVDIGDRWRQHIKRALGAEPRTQNKLYPAMYKDGIENFTFEIIEECSRSKLNEREDYWQEFYEAKDYGYSIK